MHLGKQLCVILFTSFQMYEVFKWLNDTSSFVACGNQTFSTSALWYLGLGNSLLRGLCSMHVWQYPCPLSTGYQKHLFPRHDNENMSSLSCPHQMSPVGGKLPLVENYLFNLVCPLLKCLQVVHFLSKFRVLMYIKTATVKQLQGPSRNNHRIYEWEGTLGKKKREI